MWAVNASRTLTVERGALHLSMTHSEQRIVLGGAQTPGALRGAALASALSSLDLAWLYYL
jgi:hypothetical protein